MPDRCRRKKQDSPPILGSASFTWKCIGGTPPIGRYGVGQNYLKRVSNTYTKWCAPGQAMAEREGCQGVKWSKMTDPSGVESPSSIGPVLIWQQPHPIYLAELLWRTAKTRYARSLSRHCFSNGRLHGQFCRLRSAAPAICIGTSCRPGRREAWRLCTQPESHYGAGLLEMGYGNRPTMAHAARNVANEQWDRVIKQLAPPTIRDGIYRR